MGDCAMYILLPQQSHNLERLIGQTIGSTFLPYILRSTFAHIIIFMQTNMRRGIAQTLAVFQARGGGGC